MWGEGVLTEFDPTPVNGDRRILDITVLDLLQHSSGWDHRVIGDPVFKSELRSSHSDPQQHAAASKINIVEYMMNQTLQYKPGESHVPSATVIQYINPLHCNLNIQGVTIIH